MINIKRYKICKTCNFSSKFLYLDENKNCDACSYGLEKGMKKKELKKSSPKKNKEGEEIWIKRIKEDYMFRNPECKKCGATIYNLRESKLFKKPASIVSLPIPVINGIPNPTDNNSSNHPLRHKERKSEAALKKKLQELLICKQCYYSNKRRTIGIILLLIILIIISIFILKSIF